MNRHETCITGIQGGNHGERCRRHALHREEHWNPPPFMMKPVLFRPWYLCLHYIKIQPVCQYKRRKKHSTSFDTIRQMQKNERMESAKQTLRTKNTGRKQILPVKKQSDLLFFCAMFFKPCFDLCGEPGQRAGKCKQYGRDF